MASVFKFLAVIVFSTTLSSVPAHAASFDCYSNANYDSYKAKQLCVVSYLRANLEKCSKDFQISQLKAIDNEPVLYFASKTTDFRCLDPTIFSGINSKQLTSFNKKTKIGKFKFDNNYIEYITSNDILHIFYSSTDFGISANPLSQSTVLFNGLHASYTSNYLVNTEKNNLQKFPNGDIRFDGKNYVASRIKAYGADPNSDDYPGAFWFSAKISETGKLLELLDYTGANSVCIKISQIPDRLKTLLISAGRDKLCVAK